MRLRQLTAVSLAGLSLILCGINSTFAYRTDKTMVSNSLTFLGEDGLDAVLTEPSWIPENGLQVLPNTVIPKDPQVTNTSAGDLDELVALQISFCYTSACPDESLRGRLLSEEDMAFVNAVYEIDYNADLTGEWVRFPQDQPKDAVQRFYYSEVLKRNAPGQGETTCPLFTQIAVPAQIGNSAYAHIQAIGGFDIVISGQVLQHMPMEQEFGLNSAREACEAGLFTFNNQED